MEEKTKKILENIEKGYDLMAEKFSDTRKFFWKDLEFLGDYVESGNRVLDFGCGNGRLLEILKNKKIEYYGTDVSEKLIKLAQEKYPKNKNNFSKISTQESLPFSREFFNCIFSIAVFHHFPREYQKKKIKELFDLLKPGGKIILAVWNLEEKYSEKEVYIPFRDNEGKEFNRYHYVFSQNELENMLRKVGFKTILCDTIKNRNIVYIGEK